MNQLLVIKPWLLNSALSIEFDFGFEKLHVFCRDLSFGYLKQIHRPLKDTAALIYRLVVVTIIGRFPFEDW